MPTCEPVVIGGVEYVPKEPNTSAIKIVVLQRGWVAVGRLSKKTPEECVLEDASVIRRWGTTKGLGELAAMGPRPNTVLDKAGRISFHEMTTVLFLDCAEAPWVSKL